jgi:uncharacterized protein YcfJ
MDVIFGRIAKGLASACTLVTLGAALPAAADTYTNEHGQRVECHYEQVTDSEGHPVASPLAGAVIGGVVGNQIGKGTGKDIATGAGAVAGAYAGKKYNDNAVAANGTMRQVCRPVG